MSFGFSVGDFVAIPALAWKVWKTCKEAPDDFKDLAGEVHSLHRVLKGVEDHVLKYPPEDKQMGGLEVVAKGCEDVLKDLQKALKGYESLGTPSQRTWDRVTWGLNEITKIRERLVSNVTLLTAFNSTLSK